MSAAVKLAGLRRAWAAYDRTVDRADAEFRVAADALDGVANLTPEAHQDAMRALIRRWEGAEIAARKLRIDRVAALGLGT